MSFDYWTWLVAGVVLVIVEVFAPGMVFMWVGISAIVCGVLSFFVGDGFTWTQQLLTFSVLSVVSVGLAQYYFRKRPIETTNPLLNERGAEYVGREFALERAVVNGIGQLRLGDGLWRVRCEVELPQGARVRVLGVDGASLLVEPVAVPQHPIEGTR